MAIDITGLDGLIDKLQKMADPAAMDRIATKAVDAAQPISEQAMRSAIASAEAGWPNARGEIAASVQSTKAKVNSYGAYAVARPVGRNKDGRRYGELAAYLQYGTGRGARQPHPWREKAVAAAEKKCVEAMEQVIKKELGGE